MDKSYVERAMDYANDVIDGHRPATKSISDKCQAFLNIIQSPAAKFFDSDLANSACKLIEGFRYPTGKRALSGETVELQPWQVFFFVYTFGFRKNKTVLKVGRKNGISFMLSAYAAAAKKLNLYKEASLLSHRAEVEYQNKRANRQTGFQVYVNVRDPRFNALPPENKLFVVDAEPEPFSMCFYLPNEVIASSNFLIGLNHFLESPDSAALSDYIESNQNELGVVYWRFENEKKAELVNQNNFEKSNPSIGVTRPAAYLNEKLKANDRRSLACHFGIEKE